MVKWSNDFIHWLETHPFGKGESESPNNHGTFFFNVSKRCSQSLADGG